MRKICCFHVVVWCMIFLGFIVLPLNAQNISSHIIDVGASKTLNENGYFHSEIYLIDGTERSWCVRTPSGGINEFILIEWDKPFEIDHLYIKNGFGVSKYFLSNNRVREFFIQFEDGSNNKSLTKWKNVGVITLKDTQSLQRVTFSEKIFSKKIKLVIKSIYKGDKFNDTCLSEISISEIPILGFDSHKVNISKPISTKRKNLSYLLQPSGIVEDNGSVYLSQCDTPFVKGDWGLTNDGLLYVNTIRKNREHCADMGAKDLGEWVFFNKSYIFEMSESDLGSK